MKKGISTVLMPVIVLSLACSAYAATDAFVSSVTAKPAPEIIVAGGTTDKPMAAIRISKALMLKVYAPKE